MNKETLEKLKNEVEEAAKQLLGDKLSKVILYGSYARGDFDSESDIDFALISTVPNIDISLYNDRIGEISGQLGIKYVAVVSLIIISTETFDKYRNVLPFYMNIIKEGIVING